MVCCVSEMCDMRSPSGTVGIIFDISVLRCDRHLELLMWVVRFVVCPKCVTRGRHQAQLVLYIVGHLFGRCLRRSGWDVWVIVSHVCQFPGHSWWVVRGVCRLVESGAF